MINLTNECSSASDYPLICALNYSNVAIQGCSAASVGVLGGGGYGGIGVRGNGGAFGIGVYGYSSYDGVYGCGAVTGVTGSSSGCWGGYFVSQSWPSIYASYGINVSGNLCVQSGCSWSVCHYNTSSRSLKCNFQDVTVIPILRNLSIQAWQRIDGDGSWGIGPVAEDVRDILGVGTGRAIPSLDGVALKGVQELAFEIDNLKQMIYDLQTKVNAMEVV
jgi:hypothetical protein